VSPACRGSALWLCAAFDESGEPGEGLGVAPVGDRVGEGVVHPFAGAADRYLDEGECAPGPLGADVDGDPGGAEQATFGEQDKLPVRAALFDGGDVADQGRLDAAGVVQPGAHGGPVGVHGAHLGGAQTQVVNSHPWLRVAYTCVGGAAV